MGLEDENWGEGYDRDRRRGRELDNRGGMKKA